MAEGSSSTTSRELRLNVEKRCPTGDPLTAHRSGPHVGKDHRAKCKDTDDGQATQVTALESRLEYEFGGPWGVSAMMLGFPLLMYYMWIGAAYYNGKLPAPTPEQSVINFVKHLGHLVSSHAWPSLKAWLYYWTFLIFQAICYCVLPGVWSYGKPLPHENQRKLKYYCSGVWSLYATISAMTILHCTDIFPLYKLLDEFGPLMSVAVLSGFGVAILAYFSAIARSVQHRMSGNVVYDFFMGAELNPRILGLLDLKMFFMLRLPWNILFGISCATAARQYENYGYVSAEVWFLVMAHFLYTNACAKGEECTTTTW